MAAITQSCAKCGSQFLIIDQEQKFLASKNLPLPKNCPGCRQMRRLMLRGGERRLYKTNCQQCNKEIIVAYDPQKVTNKILCKQDYDKYFLENDAIIKEPLPEV
ncbi:hypothetical protein C4577_04535 [Candidatus Parcubacteria bacterium]|nr:MAG: hypothetical protein C4577_04535 [Candidatus Parcubacteria bacterium]